MTQWKCFVQTQLPFLWPYMVSCGALQWPINIRWCWCTPVCVIGYATSLYVVMMTRIYFQISKRGESMPRIIVYRRQINYESDGFTMVWKPSCQSRVPNRDIRSFEKELFKYFKILREHLLNLKSIIFLNTTKRYFLHVSFRLFAF